MPDKLAPSEFGGKAQRNRVQPPVTPDGRAGHTPTASEQVMLTYTTGDPTGVSDPDNGEAFSGLLPIEQAKELIPEPEPFTDF